MAFIPDSIFHSTINTTWEPLRILAIYTPGGPEAFLRSLPGLHDRPGRRAPGSLRASR